MANTKKLVSIWAAVFITIYLFSVIYFNSTIEQRVVYVEDKPSTNRLLETTNLYDDYDPAIDIITPWKPNELNSLSAEEPQDHDPQHELPAHPVPQKNNNHQSGENTVQQFGSEVSYTADKDVEWLFEIPPGVPPEHQWRYKSNNVYWSKNDTLYRKFEHYKENLQLPPKSVQGEITRVCSVLKSKGRDYLCEMFTKCFPNTLSTTTSLLHDNTVYVITGDIPLMWMRDSAAQVQQYIPLLKSDPEIQILIEGVIRRQIRWISLDVYGSSYRLKLDFDNVGKKALTEWDFQCGRTIHVAQHDYEIDSLCYFIRLSYNYYQEMQECLLFDDEWLTAAKSIVDLWILEQNHNEKSSYTYPILANGGIGTRTCYTGMTWGGSRPSDDPCKYHYLIPANMFAVVALRHLQDILKSCYPQETEFAAIAHKLELEIDEGIHTYGVKDLNGKKSYVYEASGCGEQLFMDDANVPSLLAMDYLGYTSPHDPDESIKRHTIQSILSPANPYFFEGPVITGIGSPHTTNGNVWPMSVIIQAMISNDKSEINRLINMLERSDGNTGFMHESVSKSNGKSYTRPWFAWANSLFSELIYTYLDDIEPK